MAQPIRVPSGQEYGKAKEMADAQRAVPLPSAPATPKPQSAPAAAGNWEAPIVPLDAPTMQPDQHVMDGVNAGPGRNAYEAGVPGAAADASREAILNTLRGLYSQYPTPQIGQAILDFAGSRPWTVDDLALDFGGGQDQ